MELCPKDFIETRDGLIFAVVESTIENDRILCFLRYHRIGRETEKLATDQANRLLQDKFPRFLYYSKARDARLHGVPPQDVEKVYRSRNRVQCLKKKLDRDEIEEKAIGVMQILTENGISEKMIGVTGSVLVGTQSARSDIDLVIFGRDHFFRSRFVIQQMIRRGVFEALNQALWKDAYYRRGASLTFDEYLWHERRKFNKAAYRGTKFDISLVDLEPIADSRAYRKSRFTVMDAVVTDDRYAFDYPARYRLKHDSVCEAVSFTPTYAGQAFIGERVEISGFIEEASDGSFRIVVGSSREAFGEYIKVLADE